MWSLVIQGPFSKMKMIGHFIRYRGQEYLQGEHIYSGIVMNKVTILVIIISLVALVRFVSFISNESNAQG